MAITIPRKIEYSSCLELADIYSDSNDLPVLVAIDFEGPDKILNGLQPGHENCQAGLTSFDPTQPIGSQFTAVNFICGTDSYFMENISRPQWGYTERVNKNDLRAKITEFIPPNRKIILIGHTVRVEINCLQALGFNFQNISAIFDTYQLAHDFKMGSNALCALIYRLGYDTYPSGIFHTAVNDAVITLQAFLEFYLRMTPYNLLEQTYIDAQNLCRYAINKSRCYALTLQDTTTPI